MIDPRALQQHFRGVQQRQEPKRVPVPRVPDPKPLTAIEAIPVPEPIIEQVEEIIPAPKVEPTDLVIDTPPIIEEIENLVIEEIEELVIEEPKEEPVVIEEPEPVPKEVLEIKETKEKAEPKTENPYGYSAPKEKEEDYDPYGYYSGPKF